MLFSFLITGLLAAMTPETPNLDALRWNHRVLLLFAPNPNDPQLVQQKQMLNKSPASLQERDLKIFEITGTAEAAQQLRDTFHVKGDAFSVVLVGKDGSQKLKRFEPTDPNHIFKLIDSMPMRKEEMRRGQ